MHAHTEGSVIINIADEKKISKGLPIFYNPIMGLNRDISILLLNAIDRKNMQIADPLAGSGIRALRFLKELDGGKIWSISINDGSSAAEKEIKKNLKMNGLSDDKRVTLFNMDANLFILESSGFDYIDVDPFGSPVPFLDSAITRLSRGGILAVTATDTAALAGTSSLACLRKYSGKPLRNEFMHETGIRILIKKVQEIGASHEKALLPIYSYTHEHYYRVFFSCDKGRIKADDVLKGHGFILYCRKCHARKISLEIFNSTKCDCCNGKLDYGGPLWLGALWDTALSSKIASKYEGKDTDALFILDAIKEESSVDIVGFYKISMFAKDHKLSTLPKIDALLKKINGSGFIAKRTHFDPEGIRSDIPPKKLVSIIKNIS